MKISDFKKELTAVDQLHFYLPDGKAVPAHFHITEIGVVTKNFIDCGGKVRKEEAASLQLWEADDFDHRLTTEKLSGIIALAESKLGMADLEIEVEYQAGTIGKFGLEFKDGNFLLINKQTACLALENCGLPMVIARPELDLGTNLIQDQGSCTPGGGCC